MGRMPWGAGWHPDASDPPGRRPTDRYHIASPPLPHCPAASVVHYRHTEGDISSTVGCYREAEPIVSNSMAHKPFYKTFANH